jgi:hypothetical protein
MTTYESANASPEYSPLELVFGCARGLKCTVRMSKISVEAMTEASGWRYRANIEAALLCTTTSSAEGCV